jgi:hypothetical protein
LELSKHGLVAALLFVMLPNSSHSSNAIGPRCAGPVLLYEGLLCTGVGTHRLVVQTISKTASSGLLQLLHFGVVVFRLVACSRLDIVRLCHS